MMELINFTIGQRKGIKVSDKVRSTGKLLCITN